MKEGINILTFSTAIGEFKFIIRGLTEWSSFRLEHNIALHQQKEEEIRESEEIARTSRQKEISEFLEQQILELKEREKEAKLLKHQENILLQNNQLLREAVRYDCYSGQELQIFNIY